MKRDYYLLLINTVLFVGCFIFTDYMVEKNLFQNKFYLYLFEAAWAFVGGYAYWSYTLDKKYKTTKKQKK